MKVFLVVIALVSVCQCLPEKRVVGGRPARKGADPYMAAIYSRGQYRCSGVLVHRRWIATAAHCVADAVRGSLTVTLGDYSLSGRDGTEQKFEVSARGMNPGYKTTSGYPNNLALLKLNRDATLNAAVRPIAMSRGQKFDGSSCSIVGWGKTSVTGTHSDTLNTAQAIPITNDACTSAWADVRGASIFSNQICAQNNGIQTCNGDSGSPLVCGNVLAGIASWGEKSCGGSHPFVFTRVSSYTDWINGIIAKY